MKSKKAPTYPVVLATDENYAPPCAVVMESLLQNTADPSAIKFYIYGSELTGEVREKLRAVADRHGASAEIRTPDMSRVQGLPLRENFTPDAYNKLFAPNDLREYRRLLYLDGDILIERDVRPLFDVDLQGFVAGAVPNGPAPFVLEFNRRHGFASEDPVYNTGVLLIDPQLWSRKDVAKRVAKWIGENKRELIYRDQDGVNVVLKGDIKSLGPRWNLEARHYREQWMGTSERWEQMEDDDVILHYTGPRKPWKRWVYLPRQRSYREYLEATPFSSADFMGRNTLEFELSRAVGGLRMIIEAARMRAGRARQKVVESFVEA
jgi:lipopolysaccharide biosynthesis glycosyltransferase